MSQQTDNLLEQGKEAFANNDFGDALNCFNEVLRADPANEEAVQWIDMIGEILAFRHKDYYNP